MATVSPGLYSIGLSDIMIKSRVRVHKHSMQKGMRKGRTDLSGNLLIAGRGQNLVRDHAHWEDILLLENSMTFSDITLLDFERVPGW